MRTFRWAIVLGASALFVFVSCASVPVSAKPEGYSTGYLSPDFRIFGHLNATTVTSFKTITEHHASLKEVGARTKDIWFGLLLEKLKPQGWELVLQGDFPQGGVGLVLDMNGSWKKNTTGLTQWTRPEIGLSVVLPEESFVMTGNRVFTPDEIVWKPEHLNTLPVSAMAKSDLFLVMINPAKQLLGDLGARLLPIRELDLPLSVQGEFLAGDLTLHMVDEQSARAGAVLLKLLRGGLSGFIESGATEYRPLYDLVKEVDFEATGDTIYGKNFRVKIADLTAFAEKLIPPETQP